jgi:hypothetical protein
MTPSSLPTVAGLRGYSAYTPPTSGRLQNRPLSPSSAQHMTRAARPLSPTAGMMSPTRRPTFGVTPPARPKTPGFASPTPSSRRALSPVPAGPVRRQTPGAPSTTPGRGVGSSGGGARTRVGSGTNMSTPRPAASVLDADLDFMEAERAAHAMASSSSDMRLMPPGGGRPPAALATRHGSLLPNGGHGAARTPHANGGQSMPLRDAQVRRANTAQLETQLAELRERLSASAANATAVAAASPVAAEIWHDPASRTPSARSSANGDGPDSHPLGKPAPAPVEAKAAAGGCCSVQ